MNEELVNVIETLVRSSALSSSERQAALDVIENSRVEFTTKPVVNKKTVE